MIRDWRSRWGQGDFPFGFVQLANYQKMQTAPSEGGWAFIREAQLQTLSLPNTGMAVAIDLADADNPGDIHPKNKQDVGRRLSLWALASVYGQKLEFSGPLYDSIQVEGNQIRIKFTHTQGGLVVRPGTQDPAPATLKGFAICGADEKWVWADAKIEGDSVVVSSPEVAAPVAVRYSWAMNPIGNLGNGAGLPASPFRSDTFAK
jgi:sialate O-acetylesterase